MKMAILLFLPYFPCFIMGMRVPMKDLPLHTESRYIVDANGHRLKLACVNWPSHLEPALAEGLNKQPLDAISKQITEMGFNCVRFTWPLVLATNLTLAYNTTVRQSFEALNHTLDSTIAGFQVNNPAILDLPLIDAFKEVVSNLEHNNLVVILDNHITQATWCCDRFDLNGFFNDPFFDPKMWVEGLTMMAKVFRDSRNVIGMSLRNELRGPKSNIPEWLTYMQMGAEAVHETNPNVLVILGGIEFCTDLSALSLLPLKLNFNGKLVFEIHWYSFSDGDSWIKINSNDMCAAVTTSFMTRGGFLLDKGFPLFLSEFGADQRGNDTNANRYLNCLFSAVTYLDLDFAIWSLQGSYYFRQGQLDMEESHGMLNKNWSGPRNTGYLKRISSIQYALKGPGLLETKPYKNVVPSRLVNAF